MAAAQAAPVNGPTQKIQYSWKVRLTTAGPKDLAGLTLQGQAMHTLSITNGPNEWVRNTMPIAKLIASSLTSMYLAFICMKARVCLIVRSENTNSGCRAEAAKHTGNACRKMTLLSSYERWGSISWVDARVNVTYEQPSTGTAIKWHTNSVMPMAKGARTCKASRYLIGIMLPSTVLLGAFCESILSANCTISLPETDTTYALLQTQQYI